jgi:hypothetical protein
MQKWTFEHRPRLSCCRGIRKTSCLSNDSRGEPYLLQELDRILGCGDPWVQPVVKDLRQLRILFASGTTVVASEHSIETVAIAFGQRLHCRRSRNSDP